MELVENLIRIIRAKTDLTVSDHFIRTIVFNRVAIISSNLRGKLETYDGSILPINMYGTLLAGSGVGKGKTAGIIDKIVLGQFKDGFNKLYRETQFKNLSIRANENALINDSLPVNEMKKLEKKIDSLPSISSSMMFAEATQKAIYLQRMNMDISGLGAFSLNVDEISYKLGALNEVVDDMLIAYDSGEVNIKAVAVDGAEDAYAIGMNMLLFGSPYSLLAGGDREEMFTDMLINGLARRSIFCYELPQAQLTTTTFCPYEIIERAKDSSALELESELSDYFGSFANEECVDILIEFPDDISAQILEYKHECEIKSLEYGEYQELEKLNLIHSFWTLTKLVASLAFIDKSDQVQQQHLDYGLSYVRESCRNLSLIVDRKTKPQKLAEFICSFRKPLTLFDLEDNLPFYSKLKKLDKSECLDLSLAYAATHELIIQHKIQDGIDYFTGSKLIESDQSDHILSISDTHITENYEAVYGAWEDLWEIPTSKCNYSAHHFSGGYRSADNAIQGSTLLILDVDDGLSIDSAKMILEGQKYLIVPTRSNQKEKNGKICDRYRIFLPLKYKLELPPEDYNGFMANVMEAFPIDVDPACKDIARFYYGHKQDKPEYYYGDGELFDPAEYIPSTKQNEKRITIDMNLGTDIGPMGKYLLKRASVGSRNNLTFRYGALLVDNGFFEEEIKQQLVLFNDKLSDPLPENELDKTIMKSIRKLINRRDK